MQWNTQCIWLCLTLSLLTLVVNCNHLDDVISDASSRNIWKPVWGSTTKPNQRADAPKPEHEQELDVPSHTSRKTVDDKGEKERIVHKLDEIPHVHEPLLQDDVIHLQEMNEPSHIKHEIPSGNVVERNEDNNHADNVLHNVEWSKPKTVNNDAKFESLGLVKHNAAQTDRSDITKSDGHVIGDNNNLLNSITDRVNVQNSRNNDIVPSIRSENIRAVTKDESSIIDQNVNVNHMDNQNNVNIKNDHILDADNRGMQQTSDNQQLDEKVNARTNLPKGDVESEDKERLSASELNSNAVQDNWEKEKKMNERSNNDNNAGVSNTAQISNEFNSDYHDKNIFSDIGSHEDINESENNDARKDNLVNTGAKDKSQIGEVSGDANAGDSEIGQRRDHVNNNNRQLDESVQDRHYGYLDNMPDVGIINDNNPANRNVLNRMNEQFVDNFPTNNQQNEQKFGNNPNYNGQYVDNGPNNAINNRQYVDKYPSNYRDNGQYIGSNPTNNRDNGQYIGSNPTNNRDNRQYIGSNPTNNRDNGQYIGSNPTNNRDNRQYVENNPINNRYNGQYLGNNPTNNQDNGQNVENNPTNNRDNGQFLYRYPSNNRDNGQYIGNNPTSNQVNGQYMDRYLTNNRDNGQYAGNSPTYNPDNGQYIDKYPANNRDNGQYIDKYPANNPDNGQDIDRYPANNNPDNGQYIDRYPANNRDKGQYAGNTLPNNPANGQNIDRYPANNRDNRQNMMVNPNNNLDSGQNVANNLYNDLSNRQFAGSSGNANSYPLVRNTNNVPYAGENDIMQNTDSMRTEWNGNQRVNSVTNNQNFANNGNPAYNGDLRNVARNINSNFMQSDLTNTAGNNDINSQQRLSQGNSNANSNDRWTDYPDQRSGGMPDSISQDRLAKTNSNNFQTNGNFNSNRNPNLPSSPLDQSENNPNYVNKRIGNTGGDAVLNNQIPYSNNGNGGMTPGARYDPESANNAQSGLDNNNVRNIIYRNEAPNNIGSNTYPIDRVQNNDQPNEVRAVQQKTGNGDIQTNSREDTRAGRQLPKPSPTPYTTLAVPTFRDDDWADYSDEGEPDDTVVTTTLAPKKSKDDVGPLSIFTNEIKYQRFPKPMSVTVLKQKVLGKPQKKLYILEESEKKLFSRVRQISAIYTMEDNMLYVSLLYRNVYSRQCKQIKKFQLGKLMGNTDIAMFEKEAKDGKTERVLFFSENPDDYVFFMSCTDMNTSPYACRDSYYFSLDTTHDPPNHFPWTKAAKELKTKTKLTFEDPRFIFNFVLLPCVWDKTT